MRLKNNAKRISNYEPVACAPIEAKYFLGLFGCVFFLSLLAIFFNTHVTMYIGNSYLLQSSLNCLMLVLLICFGARLLFGPQHGLTHFATEFFYYLTVLQLAYLLCQAAQFTPFAPIDSYLLWFDDWSYLHLTDLMYCAHANTVIYNMLGLLYDSIAYQLIFFPLLLMCFKRFKLFLHEYYFLLLSTLLLGMIFYYFFPTTAPASNLQSPFFTEQQYATGLKFEQIHHHQIPTTSDGGMIAFPSFHVIWAYLCVNLIRCFPKLCITLLPLNLVLALSCVLLGWHYPIDLLGSVLFIILGHAMLLGAKKQA